jgi:hypothetical protein
LFPHVPEYQLRFRLLEASHPLLFTDDLEFHLPELPKFTKTAEELTSGLGPKQGVRNRDIVLYL